MKLGQILFEAKSSKLSKKIINYMKDALEECTDLPDWQWRDPKEIVSSSRDGFIAFTDGGVVVSAYISANILVGTGNVPTAAQKTLDKYSDDAFKDAVADTLDEFPELKDVKYDIDYSTLNDNGYSNAADYLSERESDWLGDVVLGFTAKVQFYEKDNTHGEYPNKSDSMTVICDLSWEGQKGEEAYKEINFKVDLTTDAGIEKAKDGIDKAIVEVVKVTKD